MMDKGRAKEIMKGFADQRILVIGDLMLDKYIHGTVERISPEAPVPVVAVSGETMLPGGAANVTRNIRSLGASGPLCGVIGSDEEGKDLMSVMAAEGIDAKGVVTCEDVQTTVKTRVMTGRQQIVRVDWDRPLDLEGEMLDALRERATALAAEVTGIVIEDYGKGVVTQEVVRAVLEVASEREIPVGFDPKANHWLRVYGLTVATPNLKEAFLAAGIPEHPVSGDPVKDVVLRKVAGILLQKWKPKLLVITLGPHGMLLLGTDQAPCAIPTRAREVYDVSGAGDTVIAACVLGIAAGATHYEAAELANYAAGVVVGKLGPASCSRDELLACVE